MITYSVGSEYFDRSWLVYASSQKAAEKKLLKFITKNWGESEASASKENGFSFTNVFANYAVVESRDV